MKQIEVIVSPTGDVKVETKGFIGAACQEASKALERALGLTMADKLTAEYFQTEQTQTQEVRQ